MPKRGCQVEGEHVLHEGDDQHFMEGHKRKKCFWDASVLMVAMLRWSGETMNGKYIDDVWRVIVRVRADKGDEVITKEELERCTKEVIGGHRRSWKAASTPRTLQARA
jgi:hypothetical protein